MSATELRNFTCELNKLGYAHKYSVTRGSGSSKEYGMYFAQFPVGYQRGDFYRTFWLNKDTRNNLPAE